MAGYCQGSRLRTSVGKWCIEFYFDLQNVYLVRHRNAHFFQAHRLKVALWWNAFELSYDTTVSQLARVFSLARKQKVHVHLASAACFQNVECHYFGDWTKGKQSAEVKSSLKEVTVEMPQREQLSTSAASEPLTSAATCASETSVLNFKAHYFLMDLQCFVLYDDALCNW